MWKKNSAVIIVDFQKEWEDEDSQFYLGRTSIAKKKCSTLVHEGIKQGSPVIYTKRVVDDMGESFSDTEEGSDLVEKLPKKEGIKVFERPSWNPFLDTDLDNFLFDRGIDHVYVGGLSINAGVRETVAQAYNRGYSVTLVKDCCSAESSEELQFTSEDIQKYRFITVFTLKNIISRSL